MRKFTAILLSGILTASNTAVFAADKQGMEQYANELENLTAQCEDLGYNPEYEKKYTNIIRSYATIIENYENAGLEKEITDYQKNCIDDLYIQTKSALTDYITGKKSPLNTKSSLGRDININGKSLVNSNGVPKTSVGMLYPEVNDVEMLKNMGYDNIQCDISNRYVLSQNGKIDNWTLYSEEACNLSETAHNGQKSLEIKNMTSGKTVQISQYIPVLPEKEYVLTCYTKGTIKGGAKISFANTDSVKISELTLSASAYDWVKNEIKFTSGSEDYMYLMTLEAKNINNFCIDDISLAETASGRECVLNGGFEGDGNDLYDVRHSPETTMYLQKVISNAQKSGTSVCLLLAPYSMPQWLTDRYPEIKGINIDYNIYNLDSTIVRDAAELFIKTIVNQVKNYPEITSICLSNEPCYDTAVFPNTYNPKFREYLKNTHGSISALNNAYNSSYNSFNEIEMPSNVEKTPLFYDWMDFNNRVFADFHSWMAEIVKRYMPDIPVHAKVMSVMDTGDFTDMRKMMRRGNNFEYFNEFSDITGCDSWAIINSNGFCNNLKLYDFLNSVTEKPIYDSEMHITADKDNTFPDNYKTQFEGYLWQAAVHGVDMSSIWLWTQSVNKSSTTYGHVAMRPDCAAAVSKSALDQNRLAYEIRNLADRQADTAILFSDASRVYSSVYMGVMDTAYLGALYAGRKVGFVTETTMDKLKNYSTLIITDAKNVKASTLQKINDFIRGGGKIVILGKSDTLEKDEYNNAHTSDLPSKIKSAATIVNYVNNSAYPEILSSPTPYEFAGYLTDNNGIVATENGKRANEVEWQIFEDESQILVNLFNHSRSENKNITLLNGGETVTSSKNLITGEREQSVINLPAQTAKLIRIKKIKTISAEDIQSITGERNGDINKISWLASGDDNTYFVFEAEPNGKEKFIVSTTENSFTERSETPKTYIVKILNNGKDLSFGKAAACGSMGIVSDNSFEAKENCLTGRMNITNTSSYAAFGIFKMLAKDKNGNTVGAYISERLIPAGGNSVFTAEFSDGDTIDFVTE